MIDEASGYLHAERIAKCNNTIVFYEHGTFQSVYDFRKKDVPTPSTDFA